MLAVTQVWRLQPVWALQLAHGEHAAAASLAVGARASACLGAAAAMERSAAAGWHAASLAIGSRLLGSDVQRPPAGIHGASRPVRHLSIHPDLQRQCQTCRGCKARQCPAFDAGGSPQHSPTPTGSKHDMHIVLSVELGCMFRCATQAHCCLQRQPPAAPMAQRCMAWQAAHQVRTLPPLSYCTQQPAKKY